LEGLIGNGVFALVTRPKLWQQQRRLTLRSTGPAQKAAQGRLALRSMICYPILDLWRSGNAKGHFGINVAGEARISLVPPSNSSAFKSWAIMASG